jgi:propanol-preferring alcohol dehydrogenase
MALPQTQIAAVVSGPRKSSSARVEITSERPVPSPKQGEVLIKLEYSGVCHSDVHSIRGDTLMLTDVAGHEGVGKVIQGEAHRADLPCLTVLLMYSLSLSWIERG